jgi:hypothetical protein
MEQVARNKWKELREEVHGKEGVTSTHVARAVSYTWENAVCLGQYETEIRLLLAFSRGWFKAMSNQRRAIISLVESSFELNDPEEIERTIDYAAFAFGDDWDAKVDKEFVGELAAIAVEANQKKSRKMNKVLGEENVTHDRVGQDPSHNDVGRDANRRSSHNDVGRPHNARKEEKNKTDPDSGMERKSSADSALTLAIRCTTAEANIAKAKKNAARSSGAKKDTNATTSKMAGKAEKGSGLPEAAVAKTAKKADASKNRVRRRMGA